MFCKLTDAAYAPLVAPTSIRWVLQLLTRLRQQSDIIKISLISGHATASHIGKHQGNDVESLSFSFDRSVVCFRSFLSYLHLPTSPHITLSSKISCFFIVPSLSFKHSVPHSASKSPRLQNIPEVWWNIHVLPLTSFLFRILFSPLIMGFLTSCRDFCRCLAVTSGSLSPRSRLHAVLLVWALQDTHS